MKLKSTFLAAAFAALMVLPAQAAITLTISPVSDNPNAYLLQASGTGDMVNLQTSGGSTNSGSLSLSGSPFRVDHILIQDTVLNFGNENVNFIRGREGNNYTFLLRNNLNGGSTYSFSGGPVTVSLVNTYEASFNLGTYPISSSDGIFGPSATGSLTILESPIPEPSTYVMLLGLGAIAFAVVRRWKMKAGSRG